MTMSWADFGERVASARRDVGLTQQELAARLSLDRTSVTKIEAGQRTVDSLELASDKLAQQSLDELKQRSNRLCAKLSYLLEPIALIESDADTCTTQLRSSPPAQEDDQTFYYEILMRRGGIISLQRYQKQSGDMRQNVPATLTQEVLVRLADHGHQ